MSIGERISELRIKQELTQYQLAKVLDVSRQAVSKWENDQSEPDTLNLIHLAEVLKSDVEYLATGKSPQMSTPSNVITVEKIVERPIEKIIEKPVEVEKIVYIDKFHETVIEKPIIRRTVRTRYIRNPIEYAALLIVGTIIGLVIGILL